MASMRKAMSNTKKRKMKATECLNVAMSIRAVKMNHWQG
jgi:hypothetical protein